MNFHNLKSSLYVQRGRSLVEIMIALVIGLLILLAVTSLFIANKQTYRTQDDKSKLDEEGRLALHLIITHVRMAGYATLLSATEMEPVVKDSTSGAGVVKKVMVEPRTYTNLKANYTGAADFDAIRGCVHGFVNPAAIPLSCASSGGSDAISIGYVIDERSGNAVAAAAGGPATIPVDCLGAQITPQPAIEKIDAKRIAGVNAYYVSENRFFIKDNPTTKNPELYCQGNGGMSGAATAFPNPAQPIAENVEEMRITYGVSSKSGAQLADRFVSAAEINGVDLQWSNVISARICLIVRSANDLLTTAPQAYRDCNDNLVTAPDRRLRGVFSSTVTIRSRAAGAT